MYLIQIIANSQYNHPKEKMPFDTITGCLWALIEMYKNSLSILFLSKNIILLFFSFIFLMLLFEWEWQVKINVGNHALIEYGYTFNFPIWLLYCVEKFDRKILTRKWMKNQSVV
jgi:hypothetical protein